MLIRLSIITLVFGGVFVKNTNGQSHCDPEVKSQKQNGYQGRGNKASNSDRCEGLFVQPLSGNNYRFVSFVDTVQAYDRKSNANLEISWPGQMGKEIFVRGIGIKPKFYYRMDTRRDDSESVFSWDLDVLSNIEENLDDIGLRGWIEESYGDVYLPLRVRQSGASAEAKNYSLKFVTRQRLREVYMKILDEEGNTIIDRMPLEYGVYPRGLPIEVKIPKSKLADEGIYKIEFGFLQRNAASDKPGAAALWFYHKP